MAINQRIVSIEDGQVIVELVRDELSLALGSYVVESKARVRYRLEISDESLLNIRTNLEAETTRREIALGVAIPEAASLTIRLTLDRGQFR